MSNVVYVYNINTLFPLCVGNVEIREMNLAEIPEYFNLSKKYAHQIRQSALQLTQAQDSQEIIK